MLHDYADAVLQLEDLPAAILLDQAARSHAGQSPQTSRKPVMFWTLSSHRYHRSGHVRTIRLSAARKQLTCAPAPSRSAML